MQNNNSIHLQDIWCVIPTFNNLKTIQKVAFDCQKYLPQILVVDDGSTEGNIAELFANTKVKVLKHEKNLGKGQAIRSALDFIQKHNGKFMLTIDADLQHYPEDLAKFIALLDQNEAAIIIGCRDFKQKNVPGKSQFGRAFSNFWLRLETGVAINDSQSGFRSYPVRYLAQIKTSGNYYDFETEILTRASWAGLALKEVPIKVFYPEAHLRVSSFHPLLDNLRISLMHLRLIGRRLIPLPYPKVISRIKNNQSLKIFTHPLKLLKNLLQENATPLGLAISAGVGVFLGVLPLVSFHMLAVLYVTSRLHLNKIMALSVQNLCMPPFVPVACIEMGHFLLHQKWLTVISWQAIFGNIPERIWEWFLGSLVLAPLLTLIISIIIYFTAQGIQRQLIKNAKHS